jgi:hypothetical protein
VKVNKGAILEKEVRESAKARNTERELEFSKSRDVT